MACSRSVLLGLSPVPSGSEPRTEPRTILVAVARDRRLGVLTPADAHLNASVVVKFDHHLVKFDHRVVKFEG